MIAADLRKGRLKPHTTWRLDEVYLKIDGRMVYLWRVVDAEGGSFLVPWKASDPYAGTRVPTRLPIASARSAATRGNQAVDALTSLVGPSRALGGKLTTWHEA